MHSSPGSLPWPDRWAAPGKAKWIGSVALFGLISLGAFLGGVAVLIKGSLVDGSLLLSVGWTLHLITSLGVLTRLRTRRRSTKSVHQTDIQESTETADVIPSSDDIPASLLHRYAYRMPIQGRRELYGLKS